MRKAFEKNVALRRPRLRRAATPEGLAPDAPEAAQPVPLVSRPAAPPPPPQATGDADVRHERLEKIKRVVAELAAPVPRVELEKIRRRVIRPAPPVGPLPAVPARDADDVLSRVEALGAELARTRQREEALRGELHAARGDQARTAGEARAATDRLAAAYADYLLQVAVRQRAAAEREAKQPAFGCALERGAREELEAFTPLRRPIERTETRALVPAPPLPGPEFFGALRFSDPRAHSPGPSAGPVHPQESARGFQLHASRWRRSPAPVTPIRAVGRSDNRVAASIVTAIEARSAGRLDTKEGAITGISRQPGTASRTAVAFALSPRLRSHT
jgi:hypothetical protein